MICDRIRKIRTDAGESQALMGERLGVAQRTVAGWETGTRQPNIEMLIKIAETYHVTSDYILGLSDVPNMSAQPAMTIGDSEWEIYSIKTCPRKIGNRLPIIFKAPWKMRLHSLCRAALSLIWNDLFVGLSNRFVRRNETSKMTVTND